MTKNELVKAFEAVLFASGEPLSIDRFTQVFEITPTKTVEIMECLLKSLKRTIAALSLYVLIMHISLQPNRNTANILKKPLI